MTRPTVMKIIIVVALIAAALVAFNMAKGKAATLPKAEE